MKLAAWTLAVVALVGASADAHAEERPWAETKPGYVTLMATSLVGTGLRFNNPYRLATPLGTTAESVSRTAAYVDLGLGVTLGDPMGFQHGAALRWSVSVEGVPERVVVPSYLLYRRFRWVAAYGRLGVPIVLSPSRTFGVEASAGAVFFLRGGIGIAGELVGGLIYGAGTREVQKPVYPVLSGQLGLFVAYEVLP
jgi:hypothetical protein